MWQIIYSLYSISFKLRVFENSTQHEFMFLISCVCVMAWDWKRKERRKFSKSPFNQKCKDFIQRQNCKVPGALLNLTATFNLEAALRFTSRKPLSSVEENNTENNRENFKCPSIFRAFYFVVANTYCIIKEWSRY